ncbi:MAG TPA: hypothetical protein QF620_01060 [Candidatus Paceibacterota bacterium]|nr:hypothetical protein [Candidatus Paceibacterota bacterium]MDP7367919.1 hypothetical protein [Candidatus Paceibacterota bacterium]HJO89749.1 hypothetical protein [Candidatus Paceibacterota bacterium]
MEIDPKFQKALSRIKDLDIKIEDIYNLFGLISKMGFEELSAIQSTVRLFLDESVSMNESVTKILEHFSEAISDRATALFYECEGLSTEKGEKKTKIARVFKVRGSSKT